MTHPVPWREELEYRVATAMRYLPISWASGLGAMLGGRHFRRAIKAQHEWVPRLRASIAALTGITDEKQQNRLIVDFGRQMGRVYTEFPVLGKIVDKGHLTISGQEHLQAARRPVVFLGSHMANWELVGRVATLTGEPITALYEHRESDVRMRIAKRARQNWAVTSLDQAAIAKSSLIEASPTAMIEIGRAIKAGANLLIYVDEEKDGYVWAPSLGREIPYAGNRMLTAKLAVRFDMDVIPVRMQRVGDTRFHATIEPALEVPEGLARQERVRALADRIDETLNHWVQACPQHWYWLSALDLQKKPPTD